MIPRLYIAFAMLLVSSFVLADDWPQFRGPNRDGISAEKGLFKQWPKGGPKLLWTYKDAGLGFSSVAIAKGTIYTLGTDHMIDEKGKSVAKDEYVIALDENTGKELWRNQIGPVFTYKGNTYGDGPRSTPTIDGNLLFALRGDGELVCVDIAKRGAVLWRKHLVNELGGVNMHTYGYSESPLVDGDLLICTPGGKQGFLLALDKAKGNVVWRALPDHAAPYSSPVAATLHGRRQYIQTSYDKDTNSGYVSGVDAKTGKLIWSEMLFKKKVSDGIGANPVVVGNQVYATAGFGGGCHLFEIDKKQNAIEKFKKNKFLMVKNTHGGVVVLDGHVYGHSEARMWICQELATGDLAWDENVALSCNSGAVLAADGLLYLYTDAGEVGLVEATPKIFILISSFTIPQKSVIPPIRPTSRQSGIWAHPAIANGVLYLRDQEYIFAFKIK